MMNRRTPEEEMERFRRLSARIYEQYSMVPWTATPADFDEDHPLDFQKIGRRVVIDHWLDPGYVHDVLFQDLARIVGLSERKYFIDELARHSTPQREELNLDLVTRLVDSMVQDGYPPSAMLIPIELFQDMHTRWDPQWRLMQFNPERITISGVEMRLFWSNKYVPFRVAYLVNSRFAIWTARPNFERRFSVLFRQADADTMDVTVQTVFNFEMANREAVRAIEVQNLPQQEID